MSACKNPALLINAKRAGRRWLNFMGGRGWYEKDDKERTRGILRGLSEITQDRHTSKERS
jgi:hypothetical protein